MHTNLHLALKRSESVEQIAELLYEAVHAESVLLWDEVPTSTREEFRARAREAYRSCLDFAVEAGRAVMALALAEADGHYWEDLGPSTRARYRHRAFDAWTRYRWHLAESAYPEDVERQLALSSTESGKTLAERVDETRQIARFRTIGAAGGGPAKVQS